MKKWRYVIRQIVRKTVNYHFKVIFLGALLVSFLTIFSGTAHAATSLNLTVSSDTVKLNITPTRSAGTFAKSDNVNISASINNQTGYTLSIAGSSSSDNNKLINTTSSSNYLTSVSEPTTEEAFSSLTGTAYNNKWGYLPSKYCTDPATRTCSTNTSFLPAPPSSGDILDVTDSANSTPNEYSLAIGARVDSTTKIGSYTNTYNVILVANAIPYTITYIDSIIGDMPTDVDSTSESETVYISGNTPTRNGYTFNGWCTVAPTRSTLTDTCSGTIYTQGQAHHIDGSSLTNDLTLYAMWKRNTMQNVSEWESTIGAGEETTAVDTRDGNVYSVARLCMSAATHTTPALNTCDRTMLWMTQNLDLKLGPAGSQSLTNADTDLNSVSSWTPDTTTMKVPAVITNHATGNPSNSVTGWTNSNNKPYWGEGGDYYVYTSGNTNTDTIYNSMTACINGGHTEDQCRHYHVGNYYNWSAAVASNNTSSTTSDLTVMPNSICPKGWRLPNGLTGTNGKEIITEFNQLGLANNITAGITTKHDQSPGSGQWVGIDWTSTGFNNFRSTSTNPAGKQAPMYFVRSGSLDGTTLYDYGTLGLLWSSTSQYTTIAYYLDFHSGVFYPAGQYGRFDGFPVRCVARQIDDCIEKRNRYNVNISPVVVCAKNV